MSLRPKQQKLFTALRELESRGERLPRAELLARLVNATGYKEVSTYLSKYLESVVIKGADETLSIRGVLAMSDDEFAALMSQKRLAGESNVPRYETRDEWVDVVRSLLEYGAKHEFYLDEDDAELAASVLPPGAVRLNDHDQ